jgi:C4-dicarboxylate-specific signal transduction histidine kinase
MAQVKEIFSDIVFDTKRASQLIQHLRELFGGQTGNMVSVAVNSLILETLQLLNSETIGQGVIVRTNLATDELHVQANRIQLQQVLINMIRNACEAMHNRDKSERWLLIKTIHVRENKVELSIVDNGPGIDLVHIESIFEPFLHAGEGGMGMGLAICRSIVRAHQGEIRVGNSPDGGAHFRITLPIRSD